MKKFMSIVSSFSFRPLRTFIACVLIIVLCLSLSIGMGYSKYRVQVDSEEAAFEADYINLKNDSDNIRYAFRDKDGDTVLTSKDGKVKVTVPKETFSNNTSDSYPVAYVLYSKFKQKTYNDTNSTYQLKYDIRLYALFGSADDYGFAKIVAATTEYPDPDNLVVEIKIDEDTANDIVINSPSGHERGTAAFNATEKNIVLNYEMLNNDIIDISYSILPVVPDDPGNQSGDNNIVFEPGEASVGDPAWFAWVWDDASQGVWIAGEVDGGNIIYPGAADYDNIVIVRMPTGSTTGDWDTCWNQSDDTIVQAGKTLSFTGWGSGNKFLISWN